MTLPAFLYFIPAILTGALLVHLLWQDERPLALLLKLSLGIGAGLGINSLLYFLSLLVAPGRVNILAVQLLLSSALIGLVVLQKRGDFLKGVSFKLSRLQAVILILAFIAFLFTIMAFFNAFDARPQGAFDAWSVWNRAARFIYRDPENWTATLSPDLHWLTHADYPLLVPLNVAWGWEMLGAETQRVPMVQGLLFMLASIAAMFALVGSHRTIGQAGMASLVFMGASTLTTVSASLVGDMPVTFFMFVSSALLYSYFVRKEPAILALAGFMAGLAGWSKNEGQLYIAISPIVLMLVARKETVRTLMWYLAGLAIPLAVILYHKSLVPPNDLLAGGEGTLSRITDLSRYWIVGKTLVLRLSNAGNSWPFSILLVLIVVGAFLGADLSMASHQGVRAIAAIMLLQTLGYCVIYVITPHDIQWQLDTSINRLIFHIYPTALFLFFNIVPTPEDIFTE